MSIEVKIPPMGESISSGILAKWHVADGDVVKKDQVLFELETDKITSEGTAEAAGKITLAVTAGTEVKIGAVVATIDPSVTETAAPAAAPAPAAAAPAAAQSDAQSPAVRRLAAETGIDPTNVAGTGKAGRVTKGDMIAAMEGAATAAPKAAPVAASASEPKPASAAPSTPPAASRGERQTRVKMTKLRQTIANRLVAAQHNAAMLTTFNEADMSAVMGLRAKYQDDFVKKHGVKLGFMSFFVKAVVNALKEVPGINAQIDGDTIIQNHYYDIGVAVSTDKGLMVPVIRDCDKKSMAEIEKDIADAAKRARDGKITLADLEGGVFTITNGGIFGSLLATPIINAPQSAILGMHAIKERPIALNGQVVIRPMMYLALSYDHRLVDGKESVTFLVAVKNALEDPARLVLGA
ncbi:MAG: 2-oxoglutarate dehydrogenase complex dihydrolipoyllysine-residue succinyltransferase [Candidatus Didemnitutus sp.]|nr:2-oxoglutarate dehydrogenase complex dihydrolipoyllysine-residue succinyltransferase [Candidatus Didemnitutus sp.]